MGKLKFDRPKYDPSMKPHTHVVKICLTTGCPNENRMFHVPYRKVVPGAIEAPTVYCEECGHELARSQ